MGCARLLNLVGARVRLSGGGMRGMWRAPHAMPSACPPLLPAATPTPSPRVAQEMDAAGLPADSVGHTILLMAHEKVSRGLIVGGWSIKDLAAKLAWLLWCKPAPHGGHAQPAVCVLLLGNGKQQ